jgi:hypothetical protein
MGRPGINTVFCRQNADENAFNQTRFLQMEISRWQPTFQAKAEGLYNAYGATYENNILGLTTLTTAFSMYFKCQTHPTLLPSLFGGTSNFLTGRALTEMMLLMHPWILLEEIVEHDLTVWPMYA